MSNPLYEYRLPDAGRGGNPNWEGSFAKLASAELVTINRTVEWTPITRLFVPHFLAKANAFREQCGEPYPKLRLWNGNKFVEAQNWDITRQRGRYSNGTFRFGPFNLAEYVFQLNAHTKDRLGDQLLEECIAGPRCLLIADRAAAGAEVPILEAVIEGMRAAGKRADMLWESSADAGTEAEEEVEHALRGTVDRLLGAGTFVWLKSTNDRIQEYVETLPVGKLVFIIDAIDGYRMFKRHIPYWCIAAGAAR